MNVVVVKGTLSRDPEVRDLPSGSQVVGYEVTVRSGECAESVPVAWTDPPASAPGLVAGDEVVAVGRIRRRFFQSGGATQSRTELVADQVLKSSRRSAAHKAVERAARVLDQELVG